MSECLFAPLELDKQPGWEKIRCDRGVLFLKNNADLSDYIWYQHEFAGFGYTFFGENTTDENKAAVYGDDTAIYTLSWTKHESICRLVVDFTKDVPDNLYKLPENAESIVCPVTVTQMRLLYGTADCGMGYVIRLGDGRFVVIDGGVGEYEEPAYLLGLLEKQNIRPGKPVIAQWIVTHPHGDHFGTFVRLMAERGERIVLSSVAYNWCTRDMAGGFSDLTGFEKMTASFTEETQIITPHAGWTFAYPGVRFHVLFAAEDLYPTPYRDINNSSLVLRMDVEQSGERYLWLGDCSGAASAYICQKYTPETLRCSYLQVGHHGYWGGSELLYRTVNPTVLFWPCPDFWYQEITHWDCNRALTTSEAIHTIYVSGREETTVTTGMPLPVPAAETPVETGTVLCEDFRQTNVFDKGWASITGGQTGYAPMKIAIEPGRGHFSAGERRALCELVRPDLMPDSYSVTLDVAVMSGEVGLVWNHEKPTVWKGGKYTSFGKPDVPCKLTLTMDAQTGVAKGSRNGEVLWEMAYVPAEKHGLYLTVQDGSVTLSGIVVEKLL